MYFNTYCISCYFKYPFCTFKPCFKIMINRNFLNNLETCFYQNFNESLLYFVENKDDVSFTYINHHFLEIVTCYLFNSFLFISFYSSSEAEADISEKQLKVDWWDFIMLYNKYSDESKSSIFRQDWC